MSKSKYKLLLTNITEIICNESLSSIRQCNCSYHCAKQLVIQYKFLYLFRIIDIVLIDHNWQTLKYVHRIVLNQNYIS